MTDTNAPPLIPADNTIRASRDDAHSVDVPTAAEGALSVWPHNGRNLRRLQREFLIEHLPGDQPVSIGDRNATQCTASLLRHGLLRYVGRGFTKATSLTASGRKTARRVADQEIARLVEMQREDA